MTFLNDPTTGQGIADAEAVFRDGSGLPRPVDATHGMPIVNLDNVGAAIFSPAAAMVDAASNPTVGRVGAMPTLYNGSAWDLQRNNQQGTLLASAARTASTSSPMQTNYNARGVVLFLNVTAASGTGGLKMNLFMVDPVSGGSVSIGLNSAATLIIAIGTGAYFYYPGMVSANTQQGGVYSVGNLALPRQWVATVNHGDASSYTYSLGYSYVI